MVNPWLLLGKAAFQAALSRVSLPIGFHIQHANGKRRACIGMIFAAAQIHALILIQLRLRPHP
jgi:hypothetical protein